MDSMTYNENQMRVLDKYRLVFLEQLDHELVCEYLLAAGTFKEHHKDLVANEKTRFLARAKLLSLIKQRGPTAFTVFVSALYDSSVDQPHLGNLIKEFVNPAHMALNGHSPLALEARARNSSGDQSGDEYPPNDPNLYPIKSGHTLYCQENTQPLVEESIKENEEFYRAELAAFRMVPETEGVLDSNEVCDVIDGNAVTKMYEDSIDTIYPNFSKPKGLAIVFNNQNFSAKCGLPRRQGTETDKTNVVRLFQGLGYSVKVKDNLGAADMVRAMHRFSLKSEHNACHSAVVVIMTHGIQGAVYGSDGECVDINKFLSFLNASNCSALKDKPKLVFIQACRGERYDPGQLGGGDHVDGNISNVNQIINTTPVDELVEKLHGLDMVDADAIKKKIPTEADFMIAYATTPGYVSWRNSLHGSWFIQAICKVFAKYAKELDISHMMTRVNNQVATAFKSSTGHVQVPEPHMRLLKDFYFFPGVTKDIQSKSDFA